MEEELVGGEQREREVQVQWDEEVQLRWQKMFFPTPPFYFSVPRYPSPALSRRATLLTSVVLQARLPVQLRHPRP